MADQSNTVECPHSPKKEFTSVVQRKFKRTEQSRKLAEARREFLQKFGTSKPDKPDRQKLTMMDLIFYNPSSNPMSEKRKNKNTEEAAVEDVESDRDEPEENIPTDEENNTLPAPQIKVGPDGEIIIDEQSLVIENKQLKRSQEKIQKSKLVDGDSSTTYGVYKKGKRKPWSEKETVRFYKALNALGTDFSLMLSLFPGKTRRDLKTKFKKEEKIRGGLIDRALMIPNTYDIKKLQMEVEMEVREEMDKKKVRQEVELLAKKQVEEKRKKKEENNTEKKANCPPRKRSHSTARNIYKDLNKGINSFLNDESDADDESDTSSKTDSTITLDMLQPNLKKKSLRPRKIRKIYTDPDESDENEDEKVEVVVKKSLVNKPQEVEEDIGKSTNMEPGSVLLHSTMGPDGNPVYKFYMVAPVQGQQVNMENKIILNIGTVRVEENVAVPPEEHNITISADEKEVTRTPNCVIQQNIIIKPGTNSINEKQEEIVPETHTHDDAKNT